MKNMSIVRFFLASFVICLPIFAAQGMVQQSAGDASFTGVVTCSGCVSLGQHKGFTRWSWAMYKVSQGDKFVLVTSDKIYKLEGDRQLLSKYVEDKATVTGHLDGDTFAVTNITRPTKEK